MSFDIFWDKLDRQVAQKVQDIINEHFRNTNNKPSFIGNIEISDFDFGTLPPSIEIIDVTDPFPEFYLPDDVVEVDVRSDSAESRILGDGIRNGTSSNGVGVGIGVGREGMRDRLVSNEQQISQNISPSSKSPSLTSTPLSPMISSSSNASDTSTDYLYFQRQQLRLREQARTGVPLQLREDYHDNLHSEEEVPSKQDTDAQIHIAITYKGNMKMTISTELYMNYPSLMFMSLPVRLTVTGFEFSATAVIAYLRHRINFCFLEPKDPEESLLKDVHIDSEIGDKEKQVLKNVGKLEKFIVDQLRKLIDEDLVFPSYQSIEL
ncbi:11330_t:CDS:2 [Funneliformis geosporum]|uniref:Mitochondrial distribution and morphology protein 12 n=1 Tax=Funneliformis geosporum TaxID=1117311 RepID=A0A9W4WIN0_9GLOM|nr:11330_t:CDS:2 [Funneliformis geosporum]